MNRAMLWFRNDLRLSDHLALDAAMKESKEIVPLYVLDEQWLSKDRWGFQRTGPFRMKFLLEALNDLREHLREKGSDLIVMKGNPAEIVPQIAAQYHCEKVYGTKEYTSEEIRREEAIATYLPLQTFHNQPLYHPEDLPFEVERMPEVFTTFRKKVEKYSQVRPSISSPDKIKSPKLETDALPDLLSLGYEYPSEDSRRVLSFKGGALPAWNRVEHYLWNTEKLSVYKKTRNGLLGADYSSKFSPWLALGCISARAIYDEVEKYEAEVESNESTYWMKFELLWRDFFKYTAMRYGNRIFHQSGIKEGARKWKTYQPSIDKWINGQTGDAFVDANMIELKQTGFMSNRGRQNVASYLVHQLKQDWRVGAAWFESMLIDYDVTSNYGNWIYAAGVGNDPRDRVFNTKRQADMYDKQGTYRKQWLSAKGVK